MGLTTRFLHLQRSVVTHTSINVNQFGHLAPCRISATYNIATFSALRRVPITQWDALV
jgi:hypothetical protein